MNDTAVRPAVGLVHTTALPGLLRELRISLFVTTYQAQRLLVCSGARNDKISVLMRLFPRPTGLRVEQRRMTLCCRNQIWTFSPVYNLGALEGDGREYDFTFAPRRAYVTGDVAAHQVDWLDDTLLFVNTRFSCISTFAEGASFKSLWQPKFISKLLPEDRCHLNGFCVDNSKVRYVTALGKSDTKNGWREKKASGGIVIDAESQEIVLSGLSMPHAPRIYRGTFWLLESGTGTLGIVEPKNGKFLPVQRFPGFLRGLAFFDKYAFIGLCRIRSEKEFRGLPIEEMVNELKCGVFVLDITTGKVVEFMEFTHGVEELFDVEVFHGATDPHVVGLDGELIDQVVVVG